MYSGVRLVVAPLDGTTGQQLGGWVSEAIQFQFDPGSFDPGYAKEYHVERLMREVRVMRIAPVTEQLVMSFIAEKVLDLPKSY